MMRGFATLSRCGRTGGEQATRQRFTRLTPNGVAGNLPGMNSPLCVAMTIVACGYTAASVMAVAIYLWSVWRDDHPGGSHR